MFEGRNSLINLIITGTVYRKEILPPEDVHEGQEAPDTQEAKYKETTNRTQNSSLIDGDQIGSFSDLYSYLAKSSALTGDQIALQTILVSVKQALTQANSEETDPQQPEPTLNVLYANDVAKSVDVSWTRVWTNSFDNMIVVGFPTITNKLDEISGSIESRTYSISIANNVPIIGA